MNMSISMLVVAYHLDMMGMFHGISNQQETSWLGPEFPHNCNVSEIRKMLIKPLVYWYPLGSYSWTKNPALWWVKPKRQGQRHRKTGKAIRMLKEWSDTSPSLGAIPNSFVLICGLQKTGSQALEL